VTVTIPELIASPFLWLDMLAMDFLMATGIDVWEMNDCLYNWCRTYTSLSGGGTGRHEVIVGVVEIIMLAGTALVLVTWLCNWGDTDQIVVHGVKNWGQVGRAGTEPCVSGDFSRGGQNHELGIKLHRLGEHMDRRSWQVGGWWWWWWWWWWWQWVVTAWVLLGL
jgi:hypothetical protein